MPNSIQEDLLQHPVLHLSELRENFVGKNSACSKRYKKACRKWGDYFQSPVNKAAQTLESAFNFNEAGAFMDGDTNFETAKVALLGWLEIKGGDDLIEEWLRTGRPLPTEKLDIIRRRLRYETLTNDSLYDQPICRLVHGDQLRRDLDYRVVYQVTPGQSKLLNPQPDSRERPSAELPTKKLNRSQKTYWGISETFQSLVAMFDSDLGTWRPSKDPNETKEFIRVTSEKPGAAPLTPDELNIYSPLRFWSPPPAFAGSVFHMLFWRALITGKDLFGRDVVKISREEENPVKEPIGDPNSIANRARQYYVVINWFNAAKFRLAAYDRLFETLMAIASFVGGNGRRPDSVLCEIKDLVLGDQTLTDLLYPNYIPHHSKKFGEFEPLNLKLPFKTVDKPIWELARGHHSEKEKDKPTQVSHLLKFLRDKALELIIWSKYQMEIRSVGLIPCQYLYRVELNPDYAPVLQDLVQKYGDSIGGDVAGTANSLEGSQQQLQINDYIIKAIEKKNINNWVILNRVCGGTNRTVFDQEAWHDIKCLKSPRAAAASSRI